jgi:hypothetical protein
MQNNYGEGITFNEVVSPRQAQDVYDAAAAKRLSRDVGAQDRPEGVGDTGDTPKHGLHGALAQHDEPLHKCRWCNDIFDKEQVHWDTKGKPWHRECWDDMLSDQNQYDEPNEYNRNIDV